MECLRCGNINTLFFASNGNQWYCRKCITFVGEEALPIDHQKKKVNAQLKYALSDDQNRISSQVLEAYKNNKNVLLEAVCGAGKTELIYETIAYCLSNGLQVGVTIPRKDVVIDLLPRFIEAFPKQKVVAVYGDHHACLQGDIILLTTHQLYRYKNYFDLLIIDETDAFPFQGNEVLNSFFHRSLKGTYIMMSATPLVEMEEEIKKSKGVILSLNKRYHGHPLPIPKVQIHFLLKKAYLLIKMNQFIKDNKPIFVFVPTIDQCENLCNFVSKIIKKGACVHSKKENRDSLIQDFKEGKLKYLITTSVLERGVTVKNLQVIVFDAHHPLYDEKTLIQIAGRVGRKIDAPDGEVIFLGEYETEAMSSAITKIQHANNKETMLNLL